MLIYLQMIEDEASKSKFEQIYLHYRALMFHRANKHLEHIEDSEDAVHQAFVSIAENIEKINEPICTKTQAYIVTIVENKAIDICRRRQKKPQVPYDEEAIGSSFEIPDGNPLAVAMAKLSTRYRSFLLLKYEYGYTKEELAKFFGVSYEGVHSLDFRSKRKLSELLKEEEVVP